MMRVKANWEKRGMHPHGLRSPAANRRHYWKTLI
jgi:hypothetical protein